MSHHLSASKDLLDVQALKNIATIQCLNLLGGTVLSLEGNHHERTAGSRHERSGILCLRHAAGDRPLKQDKLKSGPKTTFA